MVYWTKAATIIGFVLAIIAGWQYFSQRTQTIEALKYAKEGLEHTIAATELERRAWVTVKLIETLVPAEGATASVNIQFINGGSTPALDTAVAGNVFTRKSDHVIKVPGPEIEGHPDSSRNIIGPGETMSTFASLDEPMSADLARALINGSYCLFVTGTVTYKDIFNKPHRTTFAYRTSPEGIRVLSRDETRIPLGACPIGNTAD
jgi:hypothetical protein